MSRDNKFLYDRTCYIHQINSLVGGLIPTNSINDVVTTQTRGFRCLYLVTCKQ